jgi:hypothetical protein
VRQEPPAPAAASTSPEFARPREAAVPDLITAPLTPEQPAAEQKQMSADVATAKGVEQNPRSKTSSPPLHSRSKRTPVPETRPTTIEGWMLREVTNGTAVLEGPNGIWTVKRGDTVPGVGRVESIVRRRQKRLLHLDTQLPRFRRVPGPISSRLCCDAASYPCEPLGAWLSAAARSLFALFLLPSFLVRPETPVLKVGNGIGGCSTATAGVILRCKTGSSGILTHA